MKFYEIFFASDWPHNLYVHYSYLDLFSLPLTYLYFPYPSFAMQAWVFAKKLPSEGVQYIFVQQNFGIVFK